LYKVLIIDDERPVRVAIRALGKWERLGVGEILEAEEGRSALSVMRQNRPDIVFVDMKMPMMNGVEFLKAASQEFPDVKYIVVSGYDDFEYARHAIRAGALDYLLKPVIEAELDKVLEKAVSLLKKQHEQNNINIIDEFQAAVKDHSKDYLYEIKEYIDSHAGEDISLTFFSEKYFMSREYLSRQFKREFGYNIYEYVLKIRMERARLLLSGTDTKIQDIAEFLGYKDSNYFSRAFKAYYGISPTDFRACNSGKN